MGHGEHNTGPFDLVASISDSVRKRYGTEDSPNRRFESFIQFLKDNTNAVRQPAPGSAGIGNGASIFSFYGIENAYYKLFINADFGVGHSLKNDAPRFWEELNRMKDPDTGTVSDSQIGTALKAHIPKKS